MHLPVPIGGEVAGYPRRSAGIGLDPSQPRSSQMHISARQGRSSRHRLGPPRRGLSFNTRRYTYFQTKPEDVCKLGGGDKVVAVGI
jgi:hypothetical protein